MPDVEATPPPPANIPRRTFLKTGLAAGAAVVAASGGYLALREGAQEPKPPRELKALSPAAFPVLVAVIRRVAPNVDAVDPVEIALAIDETLTYVQPQSREDMNAGLMILENGLAGLLTRGSATPFTLLTGEQQDAALRMWRDATTGLLNAAYHGLRKLTLARYYQDLERAKKIGYPGPVFEKPDPGPIEPRARLSPPFVVGQTFAPKEPAHE